MRYRRVVEPGAAYFFTLVLHGRAPLLADAGRVARWHEAVAKVQQKRPFVVEAEVSLPDHLHLLWRMPDKDGDFAIRIRLAKTYLTKSLQPAAGAANESRRLKGEREIWQRRYWEHLIRDEWHWQAHLDYIHYNPVGHGFVSRPGDWPHSTLQQWVARGVYDPWWGSGDKPPVPDRGRWE